MLEAPKATMRRSKKCEKAGVNVTVSECFALMQLALKAERRWSR